MAADIRFQLKPGMIVKVHEKIVDVNSKGQERQRIQIFEGMILALKHGNEAGATVTVRKVSKGYGVEKIFPLHSPIVEKIELVREMKVRQAKPYYLRSHKKKLRARKRSRLQEGVDIVEAPKKEVEEVKEEVAA